MSRISIRTPSASYAGAGVISGATYQAAVNQLPTVNVSYHPQAGVTDATSRDAIQAMAQAQQEVFGNPTPTSITINDGQGSLQFSGVKTRPSFPLTGGGFTESFVHEMSGMSRLRFDIYNKRLPRLPRRDYDVTSSSVAERLDVITDRLLAIWESGLDYGDVDDTTIAEAEELHESNLQVIGYWRELLAASRQSTTISALSGIGRSPLSRYLNTLLLNTMRSLKNDFMQILHALSAQFGIIFQPPSERYPNGRLVTLEYLLNNPDDGKSVGVLQGGNIGLGHQQLLPYTSVAVQGVPTAPAHPASTQQADQVIPNSRGSNVVTWPAGAAASGRTLPIGPPLWIPNGTVQIDRIFTSTGLDGDTYLDTTEQAIKVQRDQAKQIAAICRYHARNAYLGVALAPATASMLIDADLSWNAGSYVDVSGPDGGLFRGLVSSVTTTIQTGGGSGSAGTQLSFNYVEASGFNLPGKNG